jgi:uncharacterized iron-regulated protein
MNNPVRLLLLAAAALALAGCAARGPAGDPLPDLTSYRLMRTDGGALPPRLVTVEEAAAVLKDYDVVFLGEIHRHPGNHLAQMALYRAIQEKAGAVDLSLEQFERDVQPVVDDYMAGRIGEEALKDKGRAWDNYPVSYRPLVEYAKAHGLTAIAAEAPTAVVRCVGQQGPAFLAAMKPETRGWAAAELHLGDGPYKDKYLVFAAGDGSHGKEAKDSAGPGEAVLRSFAAQVTRDDTMAESIVRHLRAHPGRKVVHLNGAFHSESFLGTAERVKLRDPALKVAVVNPIALPAGAPAQVGAATAATGTFVLLLRAPPRAYVSDEEERAAIRKQMSARKEAKCEL